MKYKIIASILSGVLTIGVTNAQMQQEWPTHDKTLNDQFKALHKQLEVGSGELSKLESKVAQNNTLAQNVNTNRLSILEEQKRVILDAAPTLEKCIATTKAMGIGRANAVVNHNTQVIRQNVGRASNSYGNTNFDAVTKSSQALQTCKEEDIRDGINGCKGQAVGKYAGLDENVLSLSFNPLGKNRTISYEQAKVADRYIKNMVYGLAPARAPVDMNNSSQYEAHRKIWNARMSTAAAALAEQLGWYTEAPLNPGSSLHTLWNSEEMNSVYSQSGSGGSTKPANPSMGELVEAFVNKDFMYGGANAIESTGDQAELLRRLNQKMALNNYLLLKQIHLLNTNNTQLAAITSSLSSPIDLGQMNQLMQTGR